MEQPKPIQEQQAEQEQIVQPKKRIMNLPGKKETKKGPEVDIDQDFFPELGGEVKQLPKEVKKRAEKPIEKSAEKSFSEQKSGPPRFINTKKPDIVPQSTIISSVQPIIPTPTSISTPTPTSTSTPITRTAVPVNVEQPKVDSLKFKFSAEKPKFVSSKGIEPKEKEVTKSEQDVKHI